MNKGYIRFDSLYQYFHLNNAFFVTRAKDNILYEVIESREVDQSAGPISDETIRLVGQLTSMKYPGDLRLAVFEDFSTNTGYRFLSKNFKLEASTIAGLYRERSQIELFKWIKQHLHIKTFYETTKNTVYTQIWIAICGYLLLIIAKEHYMLNPSLHSISNSIDQVLFKRGDIRYIFNQTDFSVNILEGEGPKQLTLW